MKSFTTFVLVASAALTSAQVISNPDGTFTCPIPNAAYCVGDSLTDNIIIRCIGTVGQPGNCDDNLDGEPPFGLSFAPCWQPSATSGEAACSKNCVVYGDSGNYNGTFTLPDCTPSTTVTTSTATTVPTTVIASGTGTTLTSIVTGGPGPSGGPSPSGNGTVVASASTAGSATATPVGPTTSGPAQVTGAASTNQVGAMLAAGGMLIAYFL